MLGDFSGAEDHARKALGLAAELADSGDRGPGPRRTRVRRAAPGKARVPSAAGRRAGTGGGAAADRAHRSGTRWHGVRTRWYNALALAWTDQLDASRATLLELRAEADALGHEHVLPNILTWLGRVECFAGRWQPGLGLARGAYDSAVQSGLTVEQPYALATIGLAQAHLGDVDAARAALSEGLDVAERLEIVTGRLELLVAVGFLELSLGRATEAHATLSALSEEASAAGFNQPAILRFQPDLTEAALALDDLAAARLCRDQLASSADTLGTPWPSVMHARCGALVSAAEGDLDAALSGLERALIEHQRLEDPFERARTLLHQGIVSRWLKRKRDAASRSDPRSRSSRSWRAALGRAGRPPSWRASAAAARTAAAS